ncbi:MAG: N-6 DNA methylase [Bacteroidales bacterium]|nr:N-6 DNA methylase [Bacteroidales bacterium]
MEPLSPTLKAGIEKGIIELTDDRSRINYIYLNKSKSFTDPEEKVQSETYISLIINYNYPIQHIDMFVKVQMGSETKEADIVVYADDAKMQPLIVVECKKNEISEAEFKKAVEQGFSYAYAMAGTIKYVYVTSGLKSEFYRVNKDKKTRETITTIPFFGKDIPLYKYAKGGRQKNEAAGEDPIKQQYFDLEIITEADLTHAFQLAHQALWAGGQLNPSEAFDELDKLIFCKIWDERKLRKSGEPYDFQIIDIISTEDIDKETKITNNLYKRIIALYEEGRKKDKEVFRDDIRLTPQRVRTIVGYLQDINLSKTDLDSKGRAFETFMGSYFRGDFGQYFTPRNVVKFIVDSLPINHESKVLDSSCGSGGFLLYALDKVRKQALEYYPDPNSADNFRHWHDFAEKKLFGMEINEQIARSAKMNMIIHDDGHTNVISIDGLLTGEKGTEDENLIVKTSGNQGFEYGTFDFIITNPPFGSMVKQTECAYLHQYNLGLKEKGWLDTNKKQDPTNRDSQSTEILFIEQDFKFLADGGFLAIVIPDGILTNSSLQYVRDEIMSMFRIVAVVSLPQTAFAANGAGVKSSVLFLRKLSAQQRIDYKNKLHNLQNAIRKEHDYLNKVTKLNDDKLFKLKKHVGFVNTTGYVDKKDIEKTDEFKAWKREITEFYNAKVSEIQDRMNDILAERKKEELINYKIFMAIADEIGYDATGKKTANNDLDIIAPKLEAFINSIIEDKDSLFFLNDDVDKNKIFLIGKNTFDGRWDPTFSVYKRKTEKYEHPLVLLKNLITKNPQYGTAESGIERKSEKEPRYIRITDIDELGNLIDGLGATASNIEEQYFLQENDLLFARSGATVGKAYLHKTLPYVCFFAGYMIRIVVDQNKILPEYLFIYTQLKPYKDWVKAIQRAAAQPNINAEEYKSLPIPLPPMPIQHQIVELYNTALNNRKKKLAAAAAKLASIDSYLLGELGITLPEDNKEDIEDRMFFVDFKDVMGNRIDPYFHKPYFHKAFGSLNGKYKLYSVKSISKLITSGITPLSKGDAYTTSEYGIAFIRSGDIDISGNIDFDNILYIKKEIHNTLMRSSQVIKNDIMIAIVGATIGRIGIYNSEREANINQAIALVRLKDGFVSNYIKEVLQSSIGLLNLEKLKRPVARANVNLDEVGSIIIPVPPIDKQREIAAKITAIRFVAKQMELEAEEILKQAREEVEKMILGKS